MIHRYQRFRTALILTVCLAALASAVGCLSKHVSTLTPAQNITLSVKQALSVIADTNELARESAQNVRALFPALISQATTNEIVKYNVEVAKIGLAANTAFDTCMTEKSIDVAVCTQGAIDTLKQVPQLPTGVQTFVNAPGTNGQLTGLANLIKQVVTLAHTFSAQGAK